MEIKYLQDVLTILNNEFNGIPAPEQWPTPYYTYVNPKVPEPIQELVSERIGPAMAWLEIAGITPAAKYLDDTKLSLPLEGILALVHAVNKKLCHCKHQALRIIRWEELDVYLSKYFTGLETNVKHLPVYALPSEGTLAKLVPEPKECLIVLYDDPDPLGLACL